MYTQVLGTNIGWINYPSASRPSQQEQQLHENGGCNMVQHGATWCNKSNTCREGSYQLSTKLVLRYWRCGRTWAHSAWRCLELWGTIRMSQIERELWITLDNFDICWLDLLSFHTIVIRCDKSVAWEIIQNLTCLQAWEFMSTVREYSTQFIHLEII